MGIDYAPGGGKRKVAAERITAVQRRNRKLLGLRLGTRGSMCVPRAGIVPAAVYGAEVTGVTDKQIAEVSSMVLAAGGKATDSSSDDVRLLALSRAFSAEIMTANPCRA